MPDMNEKRYIETYTFKSVEEILRFFSINGKYSNVNSEKFVFRGIKNVKYPLIPSALRPENIDHIYQLSSLENDYKTDRNLEIWQVSIEYDIIKQFYEIADKSGLNLPEIPRLRLTMDKHNASAQGLSIEDWIPLDLITIAGLAQHYGLPTRLLDWTYDYKVGLYFAVSGIYNEKDKDADALLIAINYFYFKLVDSIIAGCPLYFFRPLYYGNPNLAAQKGLFSTWRILHDSLHGIIPGKIPIDKLVDRRPLDELAMDYIIRTKEGPRIFKKDKMIYKFIIPGKLKKDIINQLILDGYTDENMFPGLSGVSMAVKNRGKLRNII
jgi:hypothetical protein